MSCTAGVAVYYSSQTIFEKKEKQIKEKKMINMFNKNALKWPSTQKQKLYYLLMSFQTCMHFFLLLLNTNEDILNNGDDNQTVLVPIHFYCISMEVNGNWNCYQHFWLDSYFNSPQKRIRQWWNICLNWIKYLQLIYCLSNFRRIHEYSLQVISTECMANFECTSIEKDDFCSQNGVVVHLPAGSDWSVPLYPLPNTNWI